MEMHNRGFTAALHKNRTAVAHPTAVGRVNHELDTLELDTGTRKRTAGDLLFGLVAHEQAHLLACADLANHFAIDPADRFEFVGPIGGVVRPGQPGGFMRFPFRRHGKAEPGGSLFIHCMCHKNAFGKHRGSNGIVHAGVRYEKPTAFRCGNSCASRFSSVKEEQPGELTKLYKRERQRRN